jgi:hypothetical protein
VTYWIKNRPERSKTANEFIRLLDEVRKEDVRRDPTRRWRERLRRVPEIQQESKMDALPLGMPIDYFDPDYFNGLQPCLCYRITNTQVALPPDIKNIFKSRPDQKLSDKEFTEKHGAAILGKYEIIDEEDLLAYGSEADGDSGDQVEDDLLDLNDNHDEDFDIDNGDSSGRGETSTSGRKRRRL